MPPTWTQSTVSSRRRSQFGLLLFVYLFNLGVTPPPSFLSGLTSLCARKKNAVIVESAEDLLGPGRLPSRAP